MWLLMPRRAVSSGFFRIQMLLGLGLGVLAALTASMPASGESHALLGITSTRILSGVLAVAAFAGSVLWTLERRRAGTVLAAIVFVVSLTLLTVGLPTPTIGTPSSTPAWMARGVDVTSAGILGTSMTAMLLGHWYLTSPTMALGVLVRLNVYYGIAVFARAAIAALGLAGGWEHLHGGLPLVWLIFRWTAGLIGPAIACYMVANILKYKNTQSATGVLFGSVILIFIGELLAVLLTRELQYPM